MNRAAVRRIKKVLVWLLWGVNIGIIIWLWWRGYGPQIVSGNSILAAYNMGMLAGLLAVYCALVQLVSMGRVGWLEPIFGMDRLAIFHRLNGYATLLLLLAHAGTMFTTYGILSGSFTYIFSQTFFWPGLVALLLFLLTVGLSIYIIRRRLSFETWYAVHLFNYVAVALIPFHQLILVSGYWLFLFIFAAVHVLVWRFGMTVFKYWRHRFVVEKVVQETPTATSVYIAGKHLDRFKAKGGQFVLVRFFDKRMVLQEHPFSLSQLPNGRHVRLTIRQLGDFTNLVPSLKPGTPVWISGPFGAFTNDRQETSKALFIAGGIGITPIRSMLEERAQHGERSSAVMIYGNRSEADTALPNELQDLSAQLSMPIYNVMSDQADYKGEKGYVDKEKIARLVPDVQERDVFLCGPPPMMAGVVAALKELGVPKGRIHYERFSLHAK